MPPGSRYRPTAARAAAARHPQLAQSGFAPELAWRHHGLKIGREAVRRAREDALLRRQRRLDEPFQHPPGRFELWIAGPEGRDFPRDAQPVLDAEALVGHFTDLRRVEAEPDPARGLLSRPEPDELVEVARPLRLLARDGAVHGHLCGRRCASGCGRTSRACAARRARAGARRRTPRSAGGRVPPTRAGSADGARDEVRVDPALADSHGRISPSSRYRTSGSPPMIERCRGS